MGIKYDGHIKQIVHTKHYNATSPSIQWVSPPEGSLGDFLGGSVVEVYCRVRVTNGPAATFEVVSGALPTGLSLNGSTGLISGTIDNVNETANFTIRATSGTQFVEKSFYTTSSTNQPPVWNTPAGNIGLQYDGTSVNTSLVATDPDGNPITYRVITGTLPLGVSLNTNTGALTGTLGASTDDMTYYFTVRASDGALYVDRAFNFSVAANKAPVFNTPANLGRYLENTAVNIQINVTDGNGDPFTLSQISGTIPQNLSLSNTGLLSGTLALNNNSTDKYDFTLRASDGLKASTQTFNIYSIKNVAPVWNTSGVIIDANGGSVVSVQLSASDEFETITYSNVSELPSGLTLSNTGLLTGTLPVVSQDYNNAVTFRATDASGLYTNRPLTVKIRVVDAPVFTSNTNIGSAMEGTFFSYYFAAETSNPFDTITFTSDDLPDGFNLSSEGHMFGTALPVTADTPYSFTVTASNGTFSTPKSFLFTVLDNVPPVWTTASGLIANVRADTMGTAQIVATDPNGHAITYQKVSGNLPPNMNLETSGSITGYVASNTSNATYTFVASASDGVNVIEREFSIFALRNRTPVWDTASGSLGSAYEAQAFSANVSATDPDGDPVTYEITGGSLPAGLTLNGATGAITGFLPTGISQDTTSTFTIAAMDDAARSTPSTRSFTITTLLDTPPVFDTAVLPDIVQGRVYSASIVAHNTNTGSMTYTVVSGSTPNGITLNSNGVLTGTAIDFGTSTFTVEANNGIKSTNKQFSIAVEENTPPYWQIAAGSVGSFRARQSFNIALTAKDDNAGTTLIYNTISSNLPANTSLSSGHVAGTFDPSETEHTYDFTVSVSDGYNTPVNRSFTITQLANEAPTIVSNAFSVRENSVVSAQIVVSDLDNDPISFTTISSNLPANVSVSAGGLINGYVGQHLVDTDYSVTVEASDGYETVQKTIDLTVKHNNAPVWLSNSFQGTFRSGFDASFTVSASDPDGDGLTYSVLSANIPGQMSIDNNRVHTNETPIAPNASNVTYDITYRVSDGDKYTDKSFTFDVTKNTAPVWTTASNATIISARESNSVSYLLQASDAEGDAIYFSAVGLPSGLVCEANGLIHGVLGPVNSDTQKSFTGYIKDAVGDNAVFTVTRPFIIETLFNSPPSWSTGVNLGSFSQETEVSIQLHASSNNNPITYSLSNSTTLPSGLVLESNGLIHGTSPVVASDTGYNFSVTATDTVTTKTTDRSFSMTILHNEPPVWITPAGSIANALMYSNISVVLSASDPEGANITYIMVSNTLPNTITFDANTHTVSGMLPVVASDTTYNLTVGAFDGSVQTNRTFTLTSRLDTAPVWTTAAGSIGTKTEYKPFTYNLIATDPQNNGITITQNASMPMPNTLTLASNGMIFGLTPNVASDTTYTFNAIASDGRFTTERQFSLLVTKNVPPVWSTTAGSIGVFAEGANVSYQLVATDADADTLRYELVNASTLPSNLTMSTGGLISGKPINVTATINPSFTVRVTDAKDNFVDRTFSMTVNPSSDRTDPYAQQVVFLAQYNDSITVDYFGTAIGSGGAATLDTSSSKFGVGSLYFPNNVSNETVAYDASYNLNAANSATTSEYTIDFWFNVEQLPDTGEYGYLFSKATANATDYVGARINSSGQVEFTSYYLGAGGTSVIGTSNAITVGEWNHAAYVIKGSNAYVYVNGIRTAAYFITRSAINSALLIGGAGGTGGTGSDTVYGIIGHIDDFRMTNAARWTDSAFSVPVVQAPSLPYWSTAANAVIRTGEEGYTFTANVVAVDAANTGSISYVLNSALVNGVTFATNGVISGMMPSAIENIAVTAYAIDGMSNKSRDRSFIITPTRAVSNFPDRLYYSIRMNRTSSATDVGQRNLQASSSLGYGPSSFQFANWGSGTGVNATLVSDPSGLHSDKVVRAAQSINFYDTAGSQNAIPMMASGSDWTVEFWNYTKASDATATTNLLYLYDMPFTTPVERLAINLSTSGTVSMSTYSTISTTGYNFDAWNHIAITKTGTTLNLFLNGTLAATGTVASTIVALNGIGFNSTAMTTYYHGFDVWADLIYTSNFVPVWNNYAQTTLFGNTTISGYETAPYSYQTNVAYFGSNVSYNFVSYPANTIVESNGLIHGILPMAGNSALTMWANTALNNTNIVLNYTTLDSTPVYNVPNAINFGPNAPVSYGITATSPVGHELTYSLISGTMLSGYTFNSNGILTGTSSSTGSTTVTFQATDPIIGKSSTATVNITVSVANTIQLVSPSGTTYTYPAQTNVALTEAGEWSVTFLNPTSAILKMWGGAGGYNTANAGGYASGTINGITAGQQFKIWVGGGGRCGSSTTGYAGGFGGGGACGKTNNGTAYTGSGGGLSGIFISNATPTQANAILIAGGSGGGNLGGGGGGTSGGTPPGGGGTSRPAAGVGGTQSAGGARGNDSSSYSDGATAGSALAGGKGASTVTTNYSGGGGGGGYYGGGGGGGNNYNGPGGGGGSGYANSTVVSDYVLTTATGATAPNNTDSNYPAGTAIAHATNTNGATSANGAVIIII